MLAKKTNNKIHISWKVRCLNTETKSFFDKTRVLDVDSLSDEKLSEIMNLRAKRSDADILKYKKCFRETEALTNEKAKEYQKIDGFCIPGYFEDQNGNPLDEYDVSKILSGQDKPIIMGNLKSVIKLGHSEMKESHEWQQEHSDITAHFLQIWKQIAESRWLKTKNSISYSGNAFQQAQLPDLESLLYASIYFRQLIADGDKVFKLACDTYCRFVDSEGKTVWIKEEQERFNKSLNSNMFGPKLNIEINAKELIDLFWYGALFFHGIKKIKEEKRNKFRDLINQNQREVVVFNLNLCFISLFNYIQNVAGLIHYDFAYWLNKYELPKPDIMWHWSILGKNNTKT